MTKHQPDNNLQRERSIPVRSRRTDLTTEAITGMSYYFLREHFAQHIRKHPSGRITTTLGTALDIRDGKIAPTSK